jgi:hypothetical protein
MARSRHSALGALFVLLALGFAGIAAYAASASSWIVAAAAAVLCLWMGDLAVRQLR